MNCTLSRILLCVLAVMLAGCSGAPSPQGIAGKLIGRCGSVMSFGDLAWSPGPGPAGSGQLILYTTGPIGSHTEIEMMDSNGRNVRTLTSGAWIDHLGAWSPGPGPVGDGSRIAFTSYRDGNAEIYVMNADGSNQTRVTNNPATDQYPAWSPDRQKIAFVSNRDGGWALYVMNADPGAGGAGLVRLAGVVPYGGSFVFMPVGDQVLYVANQDGRTQIFKVSLDGTDQVQLTDVDGSTFGPAPSPDGKRIALVSQHGDDLQIYLMNADGSGLARLTTPPGDNYAPLWSPDGKRIVFTSNRDKTEEIYIMDADPGAGAGGGDINRLTPPFQAYDNQPVWSPDGKYIAFLSGRDGNTEIYRMDAGPGMSGSNQVRLSRNPGNQKCLQWPF